MHSKAECTKCGQRNFASLDNLETHIVKQHFSVLDNFRNVFYKCSYPNCWFRFPTELARLKHELDVHLKGDLASLTLTQMQRRYFVIQRLAIHDCLNESINVAELFSIPADPDVNNSESPTSTDDEGKKNANPVNESIDAVVEPSTELVGNYLNRKLSEWKEQQKLSERKLAERKSKRKKNMAWNSSNLTKSSTPTNARSKAVNLDRLFKVGREVASTGVSLSTTAQTSLSKLQNWSPKNSAINDKNSSESCAEKVGARLRSVTVTALDPALSINKSIHKNNETIENEASSCPFMVKDEPSLMDELAETVPVSSDHRDKLTFEPSIPKPELRRAEYENSIVKDEPCVIEELTTSFAVFPDHDYLSFSNNESAVAYPQPKRSKTEISPDTSPKASVIKDEPSVIDELASMIPGPSNYDDDLTSLPSETQPVDSDDELRNILPGRLERSKNLTTAEKEAIVKAKFDGKPWKIRKILTQRGDLTFVDSDDEPDFISPAKDCGRYPGIFALIRKKLTTSEKEAIVRAVNEGQKHEDIAKTFACRERTVSYVLNQWKSEGSVETKTKPRKTTQAMELVIAENARKAVKYSGADAVRDMRKQFGIKIDRKTGFRILQRHNLIRRKREKKKRTDTQAHRPEVVTDELKKPAENKIQTSPFHETPPMDSDDELRIIVTGDGKRKPKHRKNCTTWKKRKPKNRTLRTPEKEAIVKASNEGRKPEDIAKIYACSTDTVYRVLQQWKSEGSVETKTRLSGRKRKATEAMELEIAENAKKNAVYSVADAIRDMRKQFGIEISYPTAMGILQRQNIIRHRHAAKPQSTEDPEMHLT